MPPSYDAGGSRSSLYYARLSKYSASAMVGCVTGYPGKSAKCTKSCAGALIVTGTPRAPAEGGPDASAAEANGSSAHFTSPLIAGPSRPSRFNAGLGRRERAGGLRRRRARGFSMRAPPCLEPLKENRGPSRQGCRLFRLQTLGPQVGILRHRLPADLERSTLSRVTLRGHHRNWTGRSGQDTPERPPPGELVDASLRAGRECDPADDQVPEEFARLGDLAPQHRPPLGQPLAVLALQTRKLASTDSRHRVQLYQHSLPT